MTNNLENYLRKFYREMPLGVCRELLALYEERLRMKIEARERRGDTSPEAMAHLVKDGQTFRNALDGTDAAIREVGPDVTLGEIPGYNEDEGIKMLCNWASAEVGY